MIRSPWTEPAITINGTTLTDAESLTLCMALNSYLLDLASPEPLGEDTHGHAMATLYQTHARVIMRLMVEAPL